MLSLRSALVICCVIFCIKLQVHALEETSFTERWAANYTYRPEVVKVQDHLILVNLQNFTLKITSADASDANTVACPIPRRPGRSPSSRIMAVALGNGKIVVRVILRLDVRDVKFKPTVDLFVIVDPNDCSTLATVEMHSKYGRNLEALVPYQSSFDLFYSTSANNTDGATAPQRYGDDGKLIPLMHYLAPEIEISGMTIEPIKQYSPVEGYFASFRRNDGLLSLKLLDSHYKTIKESVSENPVDTVSTAHGNITFCYSTPGILPWPRVSPDGKESKRLRQRVFCVLLDAELKPRVTVQMHDPEGEYVAHAVVANLPGGGAVVALAHKHRHMKSELNRYPVDFYLQRINGDGTTQTAVKIGTHPSLYYSMQGMTFNNGEFCLVIVGESQPPTVPNKELSFSLSAKCVDVTKK